ncbi:hypothetical protein MPTK1_2g10060 [Marchantia polymorpha subsp. ruderalis]|uniref:Uncharacterized protein n=1 Tax=Marchantia polymorpha TaxID=3197 RepID=A0A2R6W8G1_MARPO|nr:hypothetical protein MARPO_0129s0031 [Marchantia polymorpha]BBN01761.1 hypothetical protein Mp_2g10060 [Marchantia polymorpha subsp. ruderalis]|eukprot:PTQ30144.1 hypothetical protein MARPO_0129s0031 [Marchantia polymorpha]
MYEMCFSRRKKCILTLNKAVLHFSCSGSFTKLRTDGRRERDGSIECTHRRDRCWNQKRGTVTNRWTRRISHDSQGLPAEELVDIATGGSCTGERVGCRWSKCALASGSWQSRRGRTVWKNRAGKREHACTATKKVAQLVTEVSATFHASYLDIHRRLRSFLFSCLWACSDSIATMRRDLVPSSPRPLPSVLKR